MTLVQCAHCKAEREENAGCCPKCGGDTIIPPTSNNSYVGRTILDRYRVKRRLGGGASSIVYEAEAISSNRSQLVALKFIRHKYRFDPAYLKRFVNEGKALTRLRHPNAIRCFDAAIDVETETPFLCLELFQGETLEEILERKGRMELVESLRVALILADVMLEAHEKKIVHKDIKPSNVMITREAEPFDLRLVDFGVARLLEDLRATSPGLVAGTPLYASPEQCAGKDVDERSDIYSLGILLFELLTGKHPFGEVALAFEKNALNRDQPIAQSMASLVEALIQAPMPSLNSFDPRLNLPVEIDAIIQKATAKDREVRYQSAEEFAQALKEVAKALGLYSNAFNNQVLPTQTRKLGVKEEASSLAHKGLPSWLGAPDGSGDSSPKPEHLVGAGEAGNIAVQDITQALLSADVHTTVDIVDARKNLVIRADVFNLAPTESQEWLPTPIFLGGIQLGPGRRVRLAKRELHFWLPEDGRVTELEIPLSIHPHGVRSVDVWRRGVTSHAEASILINAGLPESALPLFEIGRRHRLHVTSGLSGRVFMIYPPDVSCMAIVHIRS